LAIKEQDMPLPLIPAAIALASLASYGTKKGYDGVSNMATAKRMAKGASERHKKAVDSLENQRKKVVGSAEEYAGYLLTIKDTTFKQTVEIISKIGGRHGEKIYRALADVGVSAAEIEEYKLSMVYVESFVEGGLSAFAAGAGAGPAASTGVILFGASASTGTAIGSLGGAAATNAMLAWFGGGAISAGGGGMAMGTLMLGGIAVAPAVAVSGFILAKKGEQALTKAREYEAEINIAIADIKTTKLFLNKIITQINERYKVISKLDKRAKNFIIAFDADNFDQSNDSNVKKFQGLLQIVKAQSEIMQAPIISQDGSSLDQSGLEIVAEHRTLIN